MKRKAKRKSIGNRALGKESKNISKNCRGFGYELPPNFEMVSIYFNQKGQSEIACTFFQHFQKTDWKTNSCYPIRNWKVLASDWIFEHERSVKLFERKTANILK